MSDKKAEESIKSFDDYYVSLGDLLRGERATLGKSLADVENELKLRIEILQAIENSDLSAFPSRGFIAGYIRSYAAYLELDPEVCFKLFCEETGFVSLQSQINVQGKSHDKKEAADKISFKPYKERDDVFINKILPIAPPKENFLERFSISGCIFIFILLSLIMAMVYGGYKMLNIVQQVDFAPVSDTPTHDIDMMPLGYSMESISQIDAIGLPTIETTTLENLYRPTELAMPRLIPRDGPIAGVDVKKMGVFATDSKKSSAVHPILPQPQVMINDVAQIDVIVTQPAWVRVYTLNGGILFEKILETGQRYRVPKGNNRAMLRAGNAGSVYLLVNNEPYGPLGQANRVARKVSLAVDDIKLRYDISTVVFDTPLASPVNLTEIAAQ